MSKRHRHKEKRSHLNKFNRMRVPQNIDAVKMEAYYGDASRISFDRKIVDGKTVLIEKEIPKTKGKNVFTKQIDGDHGPDNPFWDKDIALCICDHCRFMRSINDKERDDASSPIVVKDRLLRLFQNDRMQGFNEFLPGPVIYNAPKQGRHVQLYFSGRDYIIREETEIAIRESVPYEGFERARSRWFSDQVTWDPRYQVIKK